MKKNRLFTLITLTLTMILALGFMSLNAQENKEEKKVVKMIIKADDNGKVTVDTTIVFDGDYDGNWKELIDDEDLKKKIEDIEINLKTDENGNVYVMSTGNSGNKYVYVTTTEEDGEMKVEVTDMMKEMEDFHVETIDGDSTKTFIIKHVSCDDADKKVMVWHDDGRSSEHGDKKINLIVKKDIDMKVDVEDGDSVMTYTIKMEGGDGDTEYMVWKSDEKPASDKEVVVHAIKGSGDMMFMSAVTISDIGETEKNMLKENGVKMGKEKLAIRDLTVSLQPMNNSLKVAFPASELSDLSVSLLDEKGNVIFMEEIKTMKGKYIREMEIQKGKAKTYFLHITSGKASMTKKINLE